MSHTTRILSTSAYAAGYSLDLADSFGPLSPLPAKVQALAARAVRRLARAEGDAVELLAALGLGAS